MIRIKLLFTFSVVTVLFFHKTGYAQNYIINKNTITFNLHKVTGIGPDGNTSFGIGTVNRSEEVAGAYPEMKNKPEGLRDVVEYFYILDDFQFFYQNYYAGKYSKAFFIKRAGIQKWNLADTVKLSKKPIKCAFSVLAGFNSNNDIVCTIDAGNDGDFGNDVLKTVPVRASRNDLSMAIPVQIEYLAGKEIKHEWLSVLVTNNDKAKINLFFAFPEFRYARFNYQGQPYFICTQAYSTQSHITVLPDIPNFDSVPYENRIDLNQFVHIGGKEFKFTGYEDNGNKICLTGNDLQGFSSSAPAIKKALTARTPVNNSIVSAQAGFYAPVIKGTNINTAIKDMPFISTADLRGKYIYVDFWSTSCGPCIAEFPYLKEAYLQFSRKQFEIVGVLDERSKDVTLKLIVEGKLVWPNIKTNVKDTEISGYNINSYPTSYLIDPDGKIIAVNLRGDELINKLKPLIAKN